MPAVPRVVAVGLSALTLAGCAATVAPPPPEAASVAPAPRAQAATKPPTPPAPVVERGDGTFAVATGGSAPSGPGTPTTYVVEVEGGVGLDPRDFARAVDRTLADPRSWSARRALQRVGDRDAADLMITLASPHTVDRLCAPLRTAGYFSCANGDRAVLNVERWLLGAPSYEGRLADYRAYVVNHEVGHTLGFGHTGCPGEGRTAPVMLQQTKGLDGCTHGPWPYP